MNKKITLVGIALIALAIILGAFGAHALKELIKPDRLITFEVGVRYQFYMGLAMLIVGLNANKIAGSMNTFFILILTGICFFSGSIYLLAIQELMGVSLKFLGPITPIGGLLLITGWITLFVKILKSKDN